MHHISLYLSSLFFEKTISRGTTFIRNLKASRNFIGETVLKPKMLFILTKFRIGKDEITSCLKYHQRVYEKFQGELAFSEVKARVETRLD